MCFHVLHKQTLRKQLLIVLIGLAISVIGLVALTIGVSTKVETDQVNSEIKNQLTSVVQNNIKNIINLSTQVLDRKLSDSATSDLNVDAFTAERMYRQGYPYGCKQWYYNWLTTMAPPLVLDPRYNSWVSYADGDMSVALQPPSAIGSFSSAINASLCKTEIVIDTLRDQFTENPQILSNYFATQQFGIYGEYPGACNGNLTQLDQYDPRDDDWYQLGYQQPRQTLYTYAYLDPWVHQPMISVVRSIQNLETGQTMGAAGSDMLTENLQSQIQSAVYLNGRTVMIEADTGSVIADSQSNNVALQPYTSVGIDTETFQALLDQPQVLINNGQFYLYSQYLQTGDQQYLVVAYIAISDVDAPIEQVSSDIQTIANSNGITIGVVAAVITVVICGLIYYLVDDLVRPLQDIMTRAESIADRSGEADNLFEGVELNPIDGKIDQTKRFQEQFRKVQVNMKQYYSQHGQQAGLVANKYYRDPTVNNGPEEAILIHMDPPPYEQ